MKPSIAAKLEQLVRRLEELNQLLSSENATRDLEQFRRLSREHAEITPVVERYREYRSAEADLATATEMLADPDPSIKALNARDPLTQYKIEMERLSLLRPAIETARTKVTGFGNIDKATLERQIEYVGAAVQFKAKPEADALFNASFLPPQAERMPLK